MPDYQKMYTSLFNEVTGAIEALQQAQRNAERLYVTTDELRVVPGLPSPKAPENSRKP